MLYHYQTSGVCSRAVDIEIGDDGKIASVRFEGGCPGNTFGIGQLVKGMEIDEVIARLSGVRCGGKSTSCPDQLAEALKKIRAQRS